jgi:hypothetical protein
MVWTLREPMLAEAVNNPTLPRGSAAEPKWDGYRALVARYAHGRAVIRMVAFERLRGRLDLTPAEAAGRAWVSDGIGVSAVHTLDHDRAPQLGDRP